MSDTLSPAARAILSDLEPMIAEAERTGKWLHCSYQDLNFPPAVLREEHAKGNYVWGRVNWEIIDPPTGKLKIVFSYIDAKGRHRNATIDCDLSEKKSQEQWAGIPIKVQQVLETIREDFPTTF